MSVTKLQSNVIDSLGRQHAILKPEIHKDQFNLYKFSKKSATLNYNNRILQLSCSAHLH